MKRKVTVLSAAVLLLIGAAVAVNWLGLQRSANQALKRDPRNEGITIWVYYQYGVNPQQVVFDLRDVSGSKSRADVFRALLQFAESKKKRRYRSVILSYRGRPKFVIPGDYFRTLGQEYDFQNPVYTMRTFPSQITGVDGRPVFPPREGGLLYVLKAEIEDFNELHDRWYMRDMLAR